MTAAALLALAAAAKAQTAGPRPEAKGTSDSLTFHGVTISGTIDIGVAHIDHGAPISAYYGPGQPFLIQKFNNRDTTSLGENGLGQSKIALAGEEGLWGDVSAVFKLETAFEPLSARLTDGPRSLIVNNGRPLDQYIESGDSSMAGQPFQNAAWAGLQSKTFGALTFGRQNSVLFDEQRKFDPQARSQAFSPIGYSGMAAGGGDTEDARLDNALRYNVQYNALRLTILHQFARQAGLPGGADEASIGADIGHLSVDASYSEVRDAVSAASLGAAQAAAHPGTLAATVSDNTTWSLQGKYTLGKAKAYAGYEHIRFANPARPLAVGVTTIGGYELSLVNNTAYSRQKLLQVSWVGLRYALTPRLDLTGAYYRYDQNSYKGDGCADRSAASCRGAMNAASVVATYKLTRHLDIYGGLNLSAVAGGLASGYLNTSAFGQMAGARFSF